MLQLELGFPLGRYFAASHDDPSKPEWPPHPSRVFSALVGAAYASGAMEDATNREVLQVIEALPPPLICCPDADLSPSPERYVPANDLQTFVDPRKSSHPSRPHHIGRYFPVAHLQGSPVVSFLWPVDVDSEIVQRLDRIASAVTHVGTSHSKAVARFKVATTDLRPEWRPAGRQAEVFLRVTSAGRLDELDRLHSSQDELVRRTLPMFEYLHGYERAQTLRSGSVASKYRWFAWRVREASWGIDTPETFARALRKAVLSLAGDDAPAVLHGHDASTPHAVFLPLADVGHENASGRILGCAIALPITDEPVQQEIARVLSQLQAVRLPDGQVARLESIQASARTPMALQYPTWCADSSGSHWWSTVTPVILDRTPKKRTPEALRQAVTRSLEFAGFPAPECVEILHASDFQGAPTALDIPSNFPRYHARVRFADARRGPVIAGRGRHFGVGLFRPTPGGRT